jgi:Family of unknown function (DUF6188)
MSAVRHLDGRSPGPDLSRLDGAVITQVFLHEHAAGLVFETGQGVYEWYVEEPVLFRSGDSTSWLNPKVPTSMAPMLSLMNRKVEETSLDDDGTLRVTVQSGIELVCRPHPTREVWQLTGPRGFLLVCMPSSGPLLWTER